MSVSSEVPLEDESISSGVSEEAVQGRHSTFYVMCIGLFVLVVAYLASVRLAEHALGIEFQERVDRAVEIDDFDMPVVQQIQTRIDRAVRDSKWVRWGGLRVTTLVLAQDGLTWLYVDGHAERPPPQGLAPTDLLEEWMRLLPAKAEECMDILHIQDLKDALQ